MTTKFAAFRTALAALCRQHGVYMAPTEAEQIGVWNLGTETDPLKRAALADFTAAVDAPAPPPPAAKTLPLHFDTHIEAKKHPGYIGYELARSAAERLAQEHPGSEVVPIGGGSKVRGYVVVMPKDD